MVLISVSMVIVAMTFAMLLYLGLPLRAVLGGPRDRFGGGALAFGLGVLLVFSWYWLSLSDFGLAIGVPRTSAG